MSEKQSTPASLRKLKNFVLNELNNPETSKTNRTRSGSVTTHGLGLKQEREDSFSSFVNDSPIIPKKSNPYTQEKSLIGARSKNLQKEDDTLKEKVVKVQGLGIHSLNDSALRTPIAQKVLLSDQPNTNKADSPSDRPKLTIHPGALHTEARGVSSRSGIPNISNEHELELLINMVKLPVYFEKLMAFSLLGCFNLFLYYFTMIPLRFVYLNYEFCRIIGINFYNKLFRNSFAPVVLAAEAAQSGTGTSGRRQSRAREETQKRHAFKSTKQIVSFLQVFRMDFILLVEMIITCVILLLSLDTSKAYHKIKGQNAIKLYALFGVLEMADKMLSTIGQDFLLAIYRRVSDSTLLLNNKTNIPSRYFLLLIIARWFYLTIHSTILIYQTIALNVAVNSYSNTLGTLLLSMQFGELKSSVFKKFDKEGLFQLAIADVAERFQLVSMLAIIALRNLVANKKSFTMSSSFPQSWNLNLIIFNQYTTGIVGVLCGPMVKVIGSEFIVDWLKHGYIGRFNRFKPEIYDKVFRKILVQDSVNHTNFKLQARLGVPVQAQVVTFIVLVLPKFKRMFYQMSTVKRTAVLFGAWLFLLTVKLATQLIIKKWCRHITKKHEQQTSAASDKYYVPGELSGSQGMVDEPMRRIIHNDSANMPASAAEFRLKKDAKDPTSLEKVERYKMCSKKIW
ncbi:hypothetical protein ACO0QE_002861 [Hanseniaspora vineae]